MFEKIKSFFKAYRSLLKFGPVPLEMTIVRLEECAKCEERSNETCKACSCPVWKGSRLGLKAIMPDIECPLGKWPNVK